MSLTQAHADFRASLLEAGILVPTGVEGLYGRSGLFEDVVEALDRVIVEVGADQHSERFRFAPVVPTPVFEKTDYLRSFPNLTGAISTFTGGDREHAELLAIHAEGGDWSRKLEPAGSMLVAATCHPVYPMMTGTLPDGGRRIDLFGYCFRHEPSIDPARMQAFRQHEYVYVGTPDGARAHREMWVERAYDLLSSLDLTVVAEAANDPFFGRAGRMLAMNQREESLKTELVVRLYGDLGDGTAVASSNCHLDHFGVNFDIKTADGEVANSACVGFGIERIVLALFANHGLDPAGWPAKTRQRLWP
jgi:seryl-tRNA synthetase